MVRLFGIGAASALLGALLLAGSVLHGARSSHADIVAGQYSLEASTPGAIAAVGAEFTVNVGIFHSATSYQAVQWHLAYDLWSSAWCPWAGIPRRPAHAA